MTEKICLQQSTKADKKWMVTFENGNRTKTIHFGAAGYEDFTMHHDEGRKANYIARHSAREDFTITGLKTAGFWSRWLLWNQPTIDASIRDIVNRFNITITCYN